VRLSGCGKTVNRDNNRHDRKQKTTLHKLHHWPTIE
jgi:hypothetical protein